jgi:acyl carrier protein
MLPDAPGGSGWLLVRLRAASSNERIGLLQGFLRDEIAGRLGDEIGLRDRLMERGIDSIKAVDTKVAVERALGVRLRTSLLFDQPTIESLAAHLLDVVALSQRDVPAPSATRDCDSNAERLTSLLAAELASLDYSPRGSK